MFTLALLFQLISGTTQVLKINPGNVETMIKMVCPADTDFEPFFVFLVTSGLDAKAPAVKVSFSPCAQVEAIAQKRKDNTHERTALVDKRAFIVEYYVYPGGMGSAPAVGVMYDVPPGGVAVAQLHYSAEITIYEIVSGEKKKVAGPIDGMWTEKGCFEDDPVSIVKAWLGRAK